MLPVTRGITSDRSWTWRDSAPGAEVCFAGRGLAAGLEAAVRSLAPPGVEPAWLEQIHSAILLDAVAGCAGTGDALVSRRRTLALTVATADCVPVLLAAGDELAAVHAGWRGVVQRIVPAAVRQLSSPAATTAWIGPAIGGCCYEVGEDVADQVSAAVGENWRDGLVLPRPAGRPGKRPHLDLQLAVARQLVACGVVHIRKVERCTFCHDDLWSYRRDGRSAGRNLACIWPRPDR